MVSAPGGDAAAPSKLDVIATIPARAGSKRVPGKNIRVLGGHPLIAYTIAAALQSGVFSRVIVSTDDLAVAEIAAHYGAEIPFLRPAEQAGDTSPDIEWVRYTLGRLTEEGRRPDAFALLRPTSPFRLPTTIRRAWSEFSREDGVDSLRAVELCAQHPGKMWVVRGRRLLPLLPLTNDKAPWHSSQYASLPAIYIQNASLEIAWTRVPMEGGTIAGETIVPFLTEGYEGFDINGPLEWKLAEELVREGAATLPAVDRPAWETR
jgi:CMP-N,N'-diacetyllegionaminic acid synthase